MIKAASSSLIPFLLTPTPLLPNQTLDHVDAAALGLPRLTSGAEARRVRAVADLDSIGGSEVARREQSPFRSAEIPDSTIGHLQDHQWRSYTGIAEGHDRDAASNYLFNVP
jgi:hypothetical protein